MSNSIELDLKANTSQAEKAILDLTRDVDKLQKKAAQTEFKTQRSSRTIDRKDSAQTKRENVHTPSKTVSQVDKSAEALRSALGSVVSEMGAFGRAIVDTNDKFIDLAAKLSLIKTAADGFFKEIRKKDGIAAAHNIARNDPEFKALEERRLFLRNQKVGYGAVIGHYEDRDNLTADELRRLSYARMANSYYESQARAAKKHWNDSRSHITTEAIYGPSKGRLTSAQRYNRGLAQWNNQGLAGKVGTPTARNFSTRFMGMNTTRLSGAMNLARGGTAMAVSRVPMLGGLAKAATNPYVLAATAIGAAAGAPLLYANSQQKKGRQKAEDLTDLETQFKTLSKNISGVEVDALSKDLQKLSIEGVVPVQELSKGASMLMLAFKGNQKETSKWTNILADMSAGTGQSVEYFAELITKANQFGTVEFEVFNQLNEKGIPIIEQLKGKFGDTREEIMKAAQEGKITAEEFMKAFEAAHKVSMEGANARKAAASRLDIENQTKQYEELEAANVTRGYDAALMEYEKERRDRAKRRSEDEHIIAAGEALGDVFGDMAELGQRFCDFWSDGLAMWSVQVADLFGWDDDHAKATQDKILQDTNNAYYDAHEDNATSAGVQSLIAKMEKDKERLSKMAKNEEFDDDTRKRAKKYEEYLVGVIETLEKRSAELAKKEDKRRRDAEAAEARREREASRQKASAEYKKFKEKLPETEEEWLALSGEKTYAKLDNRIKWLQDRLENGYADESEFDEMERLYKIREEIDKLRKQLAKEAEEARKEAEREKKEAEKRAEEERKKQQKRDDYLLEDKVNDYSRRYEAEKNLKYRQEAEKLRKKGYSEDYIKEKLQQQDLVKRPGEDYKSKYELQYSREAEKMREMGFTQDQIKVKLESDRKDDLYYARGQLAANKEKIRQEEENIKNSKMTGKEGIENAWGSVGRVITSFTSPYEQNSLKELKEINKNLKSEINAIKGIDTKSKAQ